MNELFVDAFEYRNYSHIKKSSLYDEYLANELKNMEKKTADQLMAQTLSDKSTVSIILFLQNFKAACAACKIHNNAAM